MHQTVKNLLNIQEKVKENINQNKLRINPNIIAVSKTFEVDHIKYLIDYGHKDFGENKVQEAIEKWTTIKNNNVDLNLHLIGKLQTNKVKFALKLFDYIHSLDSEKLAKKISDYQERNNISAKFFIQVNIGNEEQKSGISQNQLDEFYNFCKKLNLNVIGLMCIPPIDGNNKLYFKKMLDLKNNLGLNELSMGMSSDYIEALSYSATYLRIGSGIFGQRSTKF